MTARGNSRWGGFWWVKTHSGHRWLFYAALLVQCVVLYAPRAPAVGGGIGLDKIVHAGVFGVTLALGLRCGLMLSPLFSLLLVHAVVSEVLQATVLPDRVGDARDVIANCLGLTSVLLWRVILGPEPSS